MHCRTNKVLGECLVFYTLELGTLLAMTRLFCIYDENGIFIRLICFYPRPVLAFGYCRCLRLCVCVSVCPYVCQSLACPRDNSGPVQARIAKFGPKMQKTLVKVPIVLGGNWPWPSRSNLTSNSKLTPFWACPNHYSPPILVRISKFGQQMHFSTVKIPVNSGLDWPWTWPSFLIPKLIYLHCGGVHSDCETVPGLFQCCSETVS